MTEQNGLRVTPASQWRKTVIMELPSGAVARLQAVNATEFIVEDGYIPDDLYPLMLKLANGGDLSENDLLEKPEIMKMQIDLTNRVVMAAFVQPRVIEHGPDHDAGEINIKEVMDIDKQFVMQWASTGGNEKDLLARFRQQSQRMLDAAQAGKRIRDTSKRDAGNRNSAPGV